MKYTLSINQLQAIELGIPSIKHAHIFDVLFSCSIWAEPQTINGRIYHWVARQKMCAELPLLNLKADTIYRYYKKLDELKLISYKKVGKKDCISITDLGKSYYVEKKSEYKKNTMSEKNTNYSKVRNVIRLKLENFPTDTNYNINNTAACENEKFAMNSKWKPNIEPDVMKELNSQGFTTEMIENEIKNYRIAKLVDSDDYRTSAHWTKSFIQTLINKPTFNFKNRKQSIQKMSDSQLIDLCTKNQIHSIGLNRPELLKKLEKFNLKNKGFL